MRKEVIFAIIAGLGLGLVIAFGAWRANQVLSPNEVARTESSPTPKPEFGITLAAPAPFSVLTDTPASVTGITKANTFVVVSAEDDDYLTLADAKGSFEESIDLIGGTNELLIAAFDEKGSEVSQKILLLFSTEFEKYLVDTTETQNASDSVRERVQQKVSQALNSPTALLGTVTDISENTLQIKTEEGEIEQLSVSTDTSVVKTGTTNKDVKIGDVAIGDYIIAMGFRNGNGVHNTKRILISSPIETTARKVVYGKVVKNNTKDILAQFVRNEEDLKVTPAKNATVLVFNEGKFSTIKFTALAPDDVFLAIGENAKDAFSARTIFVVKRP
jgi:hypothetical protein